MHKQTVLAMLVATLGSANTSAADGDVSTSGKFDETTGEALFRQVCQGCHMPQAQGARGAGAYPPLAANAKLAAKIYPVFMVSSGQGGMPGFKDYMSDQQIADVVNYVRSHFGNAFADSVTLEDVRSVTQR
ncbi:cytochrome c [Pseudomonas putida]|uniref:c-type cytochrome n=1 Tax=Pseudomonas putida TaxID=303 RepID=UPI0034D70B2C